MTQHECSHRRAQHRNQGYGRCGVIGCLCLAGPPKPAQPAVLAAAPRRVRARTVDGSSGLVVDVARPAERPSERVRLENMLARRIAEAGLPEPTRQYLWARPERMYRSDFAYPNDRVLLEVQGGIWAANPGRHNRGAGYEQDCERSNLAALLGWRLLAFTERLIKDGTAVETIRRALAPAEQVTPNLVVQRTFSA